MFESPLGVALVVLASLLGIIFIFLILDIGRARKTVKRGKVVRKNVMPRVLADPLIVFDMRAHPLVSIVDEAPFIEVELDGQREEVSTDFKFYGDVSEGDEVELEEMRGLFFRFLSVTRIVSSGEPVKEERAIDARVVEPA
mgnify:FL=1